MIHICYWRWLEEAGSVLHESRSYAFLYCCNCAKSHKEVVLFWGLGAGMEVKCQVEPEEFLGEYLSIINRHCIKGTRHKRSNRLKQRISFLDSQKANTTIWKRRWATKVCFRTEVDEYRPCYLVVDGYTTTHPISRLIYYGTWYIFYSCYAIWGRARLFRYETYHKWRASITSYDYNWSSWLS